MASKHQCPKEMRIPTGNSSIILQPSHHLLESCLPFLTQPFGSINQVQEPNFESWMTDLRNLDDLAVHRLWERYFQRLIEIARRRLPTNQKRAYDEEDVALSAINSFCRGLGGGRFPVLSDEGNLWALLVLIVARKAAHRVRNDRAMKRGGGKIQGESVFANNPASGIQEIISCEPTAEFARQVFEETDYLYHVLSDDNLRQIALLKMEGLTNREVADRLGCVERTIERRLKLIRQIWVAESVEDDELTPPPQLIARNNEKPVGWRTANRHSHVRQSTLPFWKLARMSLKAAKQIDEICLRFEERLRARAGPQIEEYLEKIENEHRPCLLEELFATGIRLPENTADNASTQHATKVALNRFLASYSQSSSNLRRRIRPLQTQRPRLRP